MVDEIIIEENKRTFEMSIKNVGSTFLESRFCSYFVEGSSVSSGGGVRRSKAGVGVEEGVGREGI